MSCSLPPSHHGAPLEHKNGRQPSGLSRPAQAQPTHTQTHAQTPTSPSSQTNIATQQYQYYRPAPVPPTPSPHPIPAALPIPPPALPHQLLCPPVQVQPVRYNCMHAHLAAAICSAPGCTGPAQGGQQLLLLLWLCSWRPGGVAWWHAERGGDECAGRADRVACAPLQKQLLVPTMLQQQGGATGCPTTQGLLATCAPCTGPAAAGQQTQPAAAASLLRGSGKKVRQGGFLIRGRP